MSFRKLQVESLLRRTLAVVLTQKLSDPRIEGMISITKVTVSPDFHDAFVYVSVLPEKHESKTLAALRHASRYIHRLVADEVTMGSVPQLDFRIDHALKKEAAVLLALRRAKEHDAAPSENPTPAETQVPDASHDSAENAASHDSDHDSDASSDTRSRPVISDKEKSRPRKRRVDGDELESTIKPDRRRKNSTRPRKDPQ